MLTGFRRTALVFAICAIGCGCNHSDSSASGSTAGGPKPVSSVKLTKLEIKDIKKGTGPGATAGDTVSMRYTGKLVDGSVFDSNDKPDGQPLTFALGTGHVIPGWDQGLLGMKQGGERQLSIPAALAYGPKSPSNKIPANSDLYFDVKLEALVAKEDLNTVNVKDLKLGKGAQAADGDSVTITWSSAMPGQEPFDSSQDHGGKPMTFVIGKGEQLRAVQEGIKGMMKGGERQITIPPDLGPHGPMITPGLPTVWDIKMVDLRKK